MYTSGSADLGSTHLFGGDGRTGHSAEITGDDEGPAVDVDTPVCSSCRDFASTRTIFALILLCNEMQRESARDSMPPERGWAQNRGGGTVGDLRVR